MSSAFLLTGEPGIGKTTALKKIIDAIGLEQCGGFYTEELRAQRVRTGFQIVTLNGQVGVIADMDSSSSIRVGKYRVNLQDLEAVGVAAIYKAIEDKHFIVIDEIGPMQLYSEKFKQAVIDALNSLCPLVGTVVLRPYPWVNELRQNKKVNLFELTADNRESMVQKLLFALRATEGKA
jgi:nucleoside-triphosphatase